MWIQDKQGTWVNLEMVTRIGNDGKGEYIAVCMDGKKVTIDKESYEKSMRWIDPEWYNKHLDGKKDGVDINKAIKAIMKATGAKLEDKEKEED